MGRFSKCRVTLKLAGASEKIPEEVWVKLKQLEYVNHLQDKVIELVKKLNHIAVNDNNSLRSG